MVGYYSQGVPTTAELENNTNQKKYTVNRGPKGDLSISRPACALFVMGALLLAAVAAVVTYFLLSRCNGDSSPVACKKNMECDDGEQMLPEAVTKVLQRLPKSIEPTHYRLYIIPFLGGNLTTHGNVTITLKIKESTDKISVNAKDLDISPSSVAVKQLNDGRIIKINRQKLDSDAQLYSLELAESLDPALQYQLEMTFNGFLNDDMIGFYRSHYVDSANTTRWLASTQFSPTDARRAFPCFDEPSFKSNYMISIGRPPGMSSLSNMPQNISSEIESDTLVWDHYQETPPMSSYLVAFVVFDFMQYKHNFSGKLFTIWSRRESLPYVRYAINLGPELLQYFETYFSTKFPLPKIDIVAIPDFGFLAMENWGLITFRESALLFDDRTSTIESKRLIATVLSHELAHQWFGNLVTPSWWDDLWLKEGFATYFKYLGVNNTEPSWKILDEFYFSETRKAFNLDNLPSSRPLHFSVQNRHDIREAFDSISYSKGASLIRMMSGFLGDDTFKEGLKKFLAMKQYANANHDDLWDALNEQAHAYGVLNDNETVNEIMDTWLHHAGYPVITVTGNYEDNTLHITQKRFLLHGKYEGDAKWHVPIWYTSGNNPMFGSRKPDMWLKNEVAAGIPLNLNKWYILNYNQMGYYMVNYDEKNWDSLIENVMNFTSATRAQLISDSMDLARAGLLDYHIPLKFVETMSKRDKIVEYVPLLTVFDKLTFLYNILKSTPAFGNFENFIWSSYSFAFDHIGFDETSKDTYVIQSIRRVVLQWACKKQESRCSVSARLLYRRWMTEGFVIPPNVREVIYCTAIREGGEADWNFAYKAYLRTNSASEKETLLSALGCSSKHWILARYLDLMLQNNTIIRKQDGALVFTSVAKNFVGRGIAFDFLRSNWEKINDYYGVAFGTISNMIKAIPTYMHTNFELNQIETFKKENKHNLGAAEQSFDHIIDVVKTNIEWMETNYESVKAWLNARFAQDG